MGYTFFGNFFDGTCCSTELMVWWTETTWSKKNITFIFQLLILHLAMMRNLPNMVMVQESYFLTMVIGEFFFKVLFLDEDGGVVNWDHVEKNKNHFSLVTFDFASRHGEKLTKYGNGTGVTFLHYGELKFFLRLWQGWGWWDFTFFMTILVEAISFLP